MVNKNQIENIFKERYRELCVLAHHYVDDVDEAQDVVQDVFVKLLFKKNIPTTNLQGYIYVAVRNTSLKRIKSIRTFRLIDQKEEADTENVDVSHEELSREDTKIKLYRAIEHLPPQCKKIFVLCAIEGMTYPKAAEAMHISPNTVKTHIKKAYKLLRLSLQDAYISFLLFGISVIFWC